MQKPDISIVVPSYNRDILSSVALSSSHSESIEASFEGVIEWIVVDDGSAVPIDEGSLNHLRRFTLHRHPKNLGLSAARNSGLKIASGKFVQFLDDDDILLPTKLSTQHDFLEQNKNVDVVVCGAEIVSVGGSELTFPPSDLHSLYSFLRFNPFVVNAALTRAASLQRIAGFLEESRCEYPMYGCEDWEYWIRARSAGLVFCGLPFVGVRNFQTFENMSSLKSRMERSALWALCEAKRHLENPRDHVFVDRRIRAIRQRYLALLLEENGLVEYEAELKAHPEAWALRWSKLRSLCAKVLGARARIGYHLGSWSKL